MDLIFMRLNFIPYSFLLTLSTFSSYNMDIFLASLDDEEMAKDTVKKENSVHLSINSSRN